MTMGPKLYPLSILLFHLQKLEKSASLDVDDCGQFSSRLLDDSLR